MINDFWPFIVVSIGLLLAGVFGLCRLWVAAAVALGLSAAVWAGLAWNFAFRSVIRGYSPGSSEFPIYTVGSIGIAGLVCAACVLVVARHRGAWLIVGWLVTIAPVAGLATLAVLLRHGGILF